MLDGHKTEEGRLLLSTGRCLTGGGMGGLAGAGGAGFLVLPTADTVTCIGPDKIIQSCYYEIA